MIIFAAAVIVGGVGYRLISPAFTVKVKDDPLPVAVDSFKTLSPEQKTDMTKQSIAAGAVVKNDPMPGEPPTVKTAPFVAAAHEVKGSARLFNLAGKQYLRFEDFQTINGPDLRIYLSTGTDNGAYIDLGPIQATKGNANYELPSGTDTGKFSHVLVWCRAFSVLFSYADLGSAPIERYGTDQPLQRTEAGAATGAKPATASPALAPPQNSTVTTSAEGLEQL